MRNVYFNDYMSLACDIADEFDSLNDEMGCISAIAKFCEASEIVSSLLCIGYPVASIELHSAELDGYADEYIISLNIDGIWCEPFKRGDKYIDDESERVYISSNANSKCLSHIHSSKVMFTVVTGDCEDCDDCDLYEEFDYDFDGELNCGLDECCDCDCDFMYDCPEDNNYIEDVSHYVFRKDNGDIDGFKEVITENADGCYSQYSYAYYDSCSDAVRKLAKDFGFQL